MDPFRDEARARDIPDAEIERWLTTARRCATLDPNDAHASGPLAGRLGGPPPLPDGTPAPRWPMLAVVNLAAIPADATDLPLPPDGTLLFFADTEDPGDSDDWHDVIHVPAGTPTSAQGSELRPAEDLRLKIEPSLPNRGDDTEDFPHGHELGRVWWDTHSKMYDGGALQLGGYPWVWNWNPVTDHDHAPADEWTLLASFSDRRFLVGDELGVIHWAIRRADLAARRFDRAEAYFDSY
ncbi:DUF1963 domain-containing protein [Actinoplanes sp. NPDC049265]|uniref:DUF1963 domain-containing protein n=1 Tax=Actinoplanes sp. NPDC049265 TaxID=3363902 RepID=UPI00371AA65A